MNEKSEYQLKSIRNPLKFVGLAVILTVLLISTFQTQTITFQKAIVSPDISYLTSNVQTSDEGYIAVGRKRINVNNFAYIVRFDKFGDTVWTKVINTEEASNIIKTLDNNFVVSCIFGSIIKFDISGNILFTAGNYNNDLIIRKILQYGDSTFYTCGTHFSSNFNPYFAKFDINGNILWDTVYNTMQSGQFFDFDIANNNSVSLIGNFNLNINDPSYLFLLKTDLSGKQLFMNVLTEFPYLTPTSMIKSNTDAYIVTCSGNTIIKFKPNGSFEWKRNFDSLIQSSNTSITKTIDDNFVYTGYIDTGSYSVVRVRKIDTNGNNLWNRIIGIDNHICTPWDIKNTLDSGFIIVGRTNFMSDDPYILKLDKFGQLNPVIGIININEIASSGYTLYQNYPNPFNPSTEIKFEVNNVSKVVICIFDVNGKLISALINGVFAKGTHTVIFNANELSSGVYFYKMLAESGAKIVFSFTKKFIYLK